MAADEQPAMAYLVLLDTGHLFSGHFDEKRARTIARSVKGAVVAVPIIADYRTKKTRDG